MATLVVAWTSSARANVDVADSKDVGSFPRFPQAWIIDYDAADQTEAYEFVTGAIDKIRREARIEESVNVEGRRTSVTYRLPDNTDLRDIVKFIESALEHATKVAFSCRGPDCGRSTIWANDVFSEPLLSAPNQQQYYAAAVFGSDPATLVAVYGVKRANRRAYLRVDEIADVQGIQFQDNDDLAARLARMGRVVIEGVVPDSDGRLSAAALAEVAGVAARIGEHAPLYAVCHTYGSKSASELLAAANQCAEEVAGVLGENGVTAVAFGAGPLAPLGNQPSPRVELVAPRLLRSE